MSTQKIIAAALAGAVAGLVAGVLFAPDKGSETRKRLVDSSKKVADNVKEYTQSGVSAISSIKEKLLTKKDQFEQNMAENTRG